MMVLTSYPTFVEVALNELGTVFSNVQRVSIYRNGVESIGVVGTGLSECVRITFTRGDAIEITYSMVESFDGSPVLSNLELYRKLNQINA